MQAWVFCLARWHSLLPFIRIAGFPTVPIVACTLSMCHAQDWQSDSSVLQVTLVHLYQAGMFADLDQISTASRSAPLASSNKGEGRGRGRGRGRVSAPVAGAKVSAAEAPLREEVQHKLQHLPPALLNTCQQVSVCLFSVCLPACLSVCLPACLSVYLSVCRSACLCIHPSVCLPACCLPVCLSNCLPGCLSVCLCTCLSVCLFVCVSVCLSACLLSVFAVLVVIASATRSTVTCARGTCIGRRTR